MPNQCDNVPTQCDNVPTQCDNVTNQCDNVTNCQTNKTINNDSDKVINIKKTKEAQIDSETIKPELRLPATFEIRSEDFLPEKYETEARLKALLCDKVINALSKSKSKTLGWKTVTEAYNSKLLVPDLFEIKGKQSTRSIQRWVKTYKDNDRDYLALAPNYISKERGRCVTQVEQDYLLSLLLDANRVKIGSAIRKMKQVARLGLIESNSSAATLRRWVEDYKKNNIQIWTLKREGEKFYDEHINMTILRDQSLIKVGDIWVTDGHVLAFDIIDPYTGKTKRMTMIMYFDWASRMPVGLSLSPTEDSENIKLAFRNGCLNAQYAPLFLIQDNGRAFRSKIFHKKWDKHDLEIELAGVYTRVGTQVSFAKAYNAKSKVIERFFLTFQEDFERYIDTFRGSKIGDKPANLSRNEKWVKSLKERKPFTMQQAMQMIDFYITQMYANTPHDGLNGKTPKEVWDSAKIDEKRYLSAEKVNHLMLTREIKKIGNNGITFSKIIFYNDKLISHVGQPCIIRYDFRNLKMIKVYDAKNRFICNAFARQLTDPLVRLSNNELSKQHLSRELKQIASNKKKAKKIAEDEALRIAESVGDIQINYKQDSVTYNDATMLEIEKQPKSIDERISDEMEYTPESLKINKKPLELDDDNETELDLSKLGFII